MDICFARFKNFRWTVTLDEAIAMQSDVEVGPYIKDFTVEFLNPNTKKWVNFNESSKLAENWDSRVRLIARNSRGDVAVTRETGIRIMSTLEEKEPERVNVNKGFYPTAEIVDVGMPTRWKRKPEGLIVHFTAGWSSKESNAVNTLRHGKKNGYTYHSMSESGQIYQDLSVEEMGYHCGTYHHRTHVGLEICNGGKLTNGKTWFGYKPPADRVRKYKDPNYPQHNGEYMTYKKEQESSLIDFCLWLKESYPDSFKFDNVLGHHEISRYKSDPCGALSMTMPKFREHLKKLWENKTK